MSTGLAALTDEQLILGCRDCTPDRARYLVGELARRHMERVASFVYGFVGDPTAAQDLAQEAFIRVYKHRQRYKEIARFSTWLYTIARNLALNEVRNRKHRPSLALDREAGGEQGGARVGALVAADCETPSEAAGRSDLQDLVRREIQALAPNHRAVVVLCDLEERPYAEAAEILGVPIGTVRSRLSRAREQLAVQLRKVLDA